MGYVYTALVAIVAGAVAAYTFRGVIYYAITSVRVWLSKRFKYER